MPPITVRVRNMGTLQAKVKRLPMEYQARTIIGLRRIAPLIEEDIKKELRSGGRRGRRVRRHNPTRVVVASGPNEPPADDRGMLANSIEVDVDPIQFNLTLSALAHYARHLEFGTRHMFPRPFLRPALFRWRRRIIDSIQEAIRSRP